MSLESMEPEEVFEEIVKKIPQAKKFQGYLCGLIRFFRNAKVVCSPIRLGKRAGMMEYEVQVPGARDYFGVYKVLLTDGIQTFGFSGAPTVGFHINKYGGEDSPMLIRTLNGVESINANVRYLFEGMHSNGFITPGMKGSGETEMRIISQMILESAYQNIKKCDRQIRDIDFSEKAKELWDAKMKRSVGSAAKKKVAGKLGRVMSLREDFIKIPASDILTALQIAAINPDLLDKLASYVRSNNLDYLHWDKEIVEEALGLAAAIRVSKE